MARARTTGARRAVSEPEQRELVEIRQFKHHQQRFIEQEEQSYQQHSRVRRFEIRKSTTVGLVFPQNFQLSILDVDAGVAHTGHMADLSLAGTPSPVFSTSDMKWWKVKYVLPPSFTIFRSNPDGKGNTMPRTSSGSSSNEIVGLPASTGHDALNAPTKPGRRSNKDNQGGDDDDKPYPLIKIKYPGWQGVSRTKIEMTLYSITRDMHHTSSHDLDGEQQAMRNHLTISRVGWSREYLMNPRPTSSIRGTYKWRSPGTASKAEILTLPAVDDGYPLANGNLVLEDTRHPGSLLAVYKQRRDWDVLGSLTVFIDRLGAEYEGEEKLSVEAVVGSCLAIVVYERIGWQNMWGA